MSSSIFDNKLTKPELKTLREVLGESYIFWEDIKKHIEATYGSVAEEWKFYGQQSGWLLKVLLKKRNLFFFVPMKDHFKLSFIFGDRAVAAVETSDLPELIKDSLRKARKYAEGRGVQIEVKSADDVRHAIKLVEIKINN